MSAARKPADWTVLAALHPAFGVEVAGPPLGFGTPHAALDGLRDLVRGHGLVVLRDQALPPSEQAMLTRRLGRPEIHALAHARHAELPEIVVEGNAGAEDGLGDAGLAWHADLTWRVAPSRLSLLSAGHLPAAGGEILFAHQGAAYERLDPWLRWRIEYLDAEHDHDRRRAGGAPGWRPRPALAGAERDAHPAVVHPVVRLDPATGQRSLFVNEGTTTRLLGAPEDEATRLLARLLAAATDPAVVLRHRWRPGDLLLWDNALLLHRVEATAPGEVIRLHRSAVSGERPVGPISVAQPWVVAG